MDQMERGRSYIWAREIMLCGQSILRMNEKHTHLRLAK